MFKNIKAVGKNRTLVIVAVLAILFVGYKLRSFSYDRVPHPGENADEYSFAWLGLSLIQEGYPIAWSGIAGYKSYDYQKINVDHIYDVEPGRGAFPINKPWFDHPPLFGLFIGGYSYLKGVSEFSEASVSILRLPMVKVAILTLIMVYLIASRLYGRIVGFLSTIIFATVPTFVISSRMALAENLTVPLFLISFLAAYLYFEKRKIFYWYLACIFAGISILMKLSSISFPLFLILVTIYFEKKKKLRLLKPALVSLVLPILIFVLYGAYYDWETFKNIFFTNSSRFYGVGAEVFFSVFNRNTITKVFNDGWIQLGWVSLFMLSMNEWRKKRSGSFITIALFSYFLIFILFGSEAYERYRFFFYPFIAISLGWFVNKLLLKPNLFVFTAGMLLPVGTAVHKLIGVNGFQIYVPFLRYFVFGLLLLFLAPLFNRRFGNMWQRAFVLLVFFFSIIVSVLTVYYYNIDTWYFAS